MKLASIEMGRVTWIVDVRMPSGSLYFPEALPKIIERYGFVKYPQPVDIVNSPTEAVFEHGQFEKSVIQRFSVHNDGFIVESLAGTDKAEAFLDDFAEWIEDEFDAIFPPTSESYRIFDSHLVVEMNIDIGKRMEFFAFISDIINAYISQYNAGTPNYEPTGIYISADRTINKSFNTEAFRLERRIGKPFKKNIYFSSGPLRTRDLLRLLQQIEDSL